jgi:diguanylate cyclase (GGDEF)-like protein
MSVSRHHARIQPGMGDFFVIDLGSTNGTFVNEMLVSMHKLQNGDILRIGSQIFRFLTADNIETHYHEELFRLTIIDELTGIPNKSYLLEFLERELGRFTRYQRFLALILFDLDRFKAVNDRLGHICGDYTLKELIRRVQGVMRKDELLARYGGEEFAVVLPETTPEGALETAERLRQLVEKEPFHFDDQPYQVTISLEFGCHYR